MKSRIIEEGGALVIDNPPAMVPCHMISSETRGELAHVCAGDLVSTAWAEGAANGEKCVLVSVLDTDGKRGLGYCLSADDARLLAASLMKLAETVDGRKAS